MAYIYIEIPQGWQFVSKMKIREDEEVVKDVFVEDTGKELILLQDMIKECLRNKDRRADVVSLSVTSSDRLCIPSAGMESSSLSASSASTKEALKINICFNGPAANDKLYVKYKHINNGKYPAEDTSIVMGKEEIKSQYSTIYGQRWYSGQFFSKDRMEGILEKDRQQRDNRRHVGDSPNPT